MSFYYTSYDVERAFKYKFRDKWHEKWREIDIYNDEVIIYIEEGSLEKNKDAFSGLLKSFFRGFFSVDTEEIRLNYKDKILKVVYEEETDLDEDDIYSLPLFKSLNRDPTGIKPLTGVPVIAFHSYKGGVGRTLSMLSSVQAISSLKKGSNSYKLLIVDADLEAPGLTWIVSKNNISDISLLDAYSILHEEDDWRSAIPVIAKKIQTIALENLGERQFVEHYFLPAYRDEDHLPYQLMDMPVTPQKMIQMVGREWIIGDFLSELGKELGVDAIFVDLRAGVSEFSAPLLFDPRIRKVYVTTTSLQSREGIHALLKEIYTKPIDRDYPLPYIFITMVLPELSSDVLLKLQQEILDEVNILNEEALENDIEVPVVFLEFAQELIHLDGFDMIANKLRGTQMLKKVEEIVLDWIPQKKDNAPIGKEQREIFLKRLDKITSEIEYAESMSMDKFMITSSIRNFVRKFKYDIPISVLLGTKGSGKTFLYSQMINTGTWEAFSSKIDGVAEFTQKTHIVPFIVPKSMKTDKISSAVEEINKSLRFAMSIKEIRGITTRVQGYQDEYTSEAEWYKIWKDELLRSTGLDFESFEELQNYLEGRNRRIVFVVDGLEDLFQNVSEKNVQKIAVRILLQDIINELRSFPNNHIGLIIFSRQDIAKNAIEQNWGQFSSQYASYELKWNRVEALRLVLWWATEAEFEHELNNIELATEEALIETLYPLWGIKLGSVNSREAKSADWVLAALSDLKGRLQARDIVRFLREAAFETLKSKASFEDRYLLPRAIKNAIKPCSKKKIEEIEDEMPHIKVIFAKFKVSLNSRKMPFKLENFDLVSNEVKSLEQQGYLIQLDDGYYMPEIIRYGLEFDYKTRARTKVLQLLRRANVNNL